MRVLLAAIVIPLACTAQPLQARDGARTTVKASVTAAVRICPVGKPNACRTMIEYFPLNVYFTKNEEGAVRHGGKWDAFKIGSWKSAKLSNGKTVRYVFQRSGSGYQITDTRGLVGTITMDGTGCALSLKIKSEKVTGTVETLDSTCTVVRK
jgi:hypothetical protein